MKKPTFGMVRLSSFVAVRCPHCTIIVPSINGLIAVHSDYRALFTGAKLTKCMGSTSVVKEDFPL